jgi:hypothetical protein
MGMSQFTVRRMKLSRLPHRIVSSNWDVTSFDTAENYGPFTNEELLGRTFKGRTQGAGSSGVTAAGFKHDKIYSYV